MPTIHATGLYRILTYRSSTTGTDGLNTINTNFLDQGAVVMVGNALYRLDRTSTAAADGVYVVDPITGPGRWNLVAGAGAGIGWVPNLAALALLPATSPYLVWVETLECYWHRNPTSTESVDGITNIAATGGGRWERMTATTSLRWLNKANWYVSVSGNDENEGDVGTPLRTLEEVSRRISVGPIAQDTTVWIGTATTFDEASISVDGGGERRTFTIRGIYTYDVADAVDTFTYQNPAAPAGCLLIADTIADWTPYVGRRLRYTSGAANGHVTYVASIDRGGASAGEALIGSYQYTPAPGDTFVLDVLTAGFSRLEVQCRDDNTTVVLRDLVLGRVSATATAYGNWTTPNNLNGAVVAYQCSFMGSNLQPIQIAVSGAGISQEVVATYPMVLYSECSFVSMDQTAARLVVKNNTTIADSVMFGGVTLHVVLGQVANVWRNLLLNSAFFEAPGMVVSLALNQLFTGTEPGITVRNCTVRSGDYLSGETGNVPLTMGPNSRFTWDSNHEPNIDNTTAAIAEILIESDVGVPLQWASVNFNTDEQKGTAQLVAGTVSVAARNSDVRGVLISRNTPGGTLGHLSAPAASRTGVGFVINSSNALDTSTVDWFIPGYVGSVIVGVDDDPDLPPN